VHSIAPLLPKEEPYHIPLAWLAYAPSSLHLMNTFICESMISISITSYAVFITIKWILAKHTQYKRISGWHSIAKTKLGLSVVPRILARLAARLGPTWHENGT
jgi:hypothetical protein